MIQAIGISLGAMTEGEYRNPQVASEVEFNIVLGHRGGAKQLYQGIEFGFLYILELKLLILQKLSLVSRAIF